MEEYIINTMRYFTLFAALFLFSFWLMQHTLSYISPPATILVSGKYYSDFGSTLPLIRSFSLGSNFPPEYPGYPGEPIRYHFLFFAVVGLLERFGLRIDHALNIPSALGLGFMFLLIFALGLRLFRRASVGILAITFLIFNGSLSWLDYLKNSGWDLKSSISGLKSLSAFPSFAPWNGSEIAAFWNLNIYTNQRHLGFSFALVLLVIYLLVSRRRLALVGLVLGTLALTNQVAFAIASLLCLWAFLFDPSLRRPLFFSSLASLPFIAYALFFTRTSAHATPHLSFLLPPPITILRFIDYWLKNIGLHLLFIPLGILIAPRPARIIGLPLLLIFAIPNTWQLSPDIVNNHKFFNFFLVFGSLYSAYALVRFRFLGILLPVLVLGGIVDIFPIINDRYYHLADYQSSPDAKFFAVHTPSDSVVLNSTWFYHPASIAGRKIFNGYSYFTWSYGHDAVARESLTSAIYSSPLKSSACRMLTANGIDYVELALRPENFLRPNFALWQNEFVPVYSNPTTGLTVYSVSDSCPGS